MARYIAHESNWAALATIAAREPIVGYPFANIFSMSDGPVVRPYFVFFFLSTWFLDHILKDNSTGIPYFYISEWEISAQVIESQF